MTIYVPVVMQMDAVGKELWACHSVFGNTHGQNQSYIIIIKYVKGNS